jgi:hypothetical protein
MTSGAPQSRPSAYRMAPPPGPTGRVADSLDEAKAAFRAGWVIAFRAAAEKTRWKFPQRPPGGSELHARDCFRLRWVRIML